MAGIFDYMYPKIPLGPTATPSAQMPMPVPQTRLNPLGRPIPTPPVMMTPPNVGALRNPPDFSQFGADNFGPLVSGTQMPPILPMRSPVQMATGPGRMPQPQRRGTPPVILESLPDPSMDVPFSTGMIETATGTGMESSPEMRPPEGDRTFGMDQATSAALLRAGLAMMMPIQPGQTLMGHLAQAGLGGLDTYFQQKERMRRADLDTRQEERADRSLSRQERDSDRSFKMAERREERETAEGQSRAQAAREKMRLEQEELGIKKRQVEGQVRESTARADLYERSAGRGMGQRTSIPATRQEFEAQTLLSVLKDPMATPEDIDNVMSNVSRYADRIYDQSGRVRQQGEPPPPTSGQPTEPQQAPQATSGGFPSVVNPVTGNMYQLGKYTVNKLTGGGKPAPAPVPKNAPKSAVEAANAFKAANKGKKLTDQEAAEVNKRLQSWYPDYDGSLIKPGVQ